MAAQGKARDQQVDMQIKWRAKLERIQGSVKKRISNRLSAPIQQVGYRPGATVKAEDWLVMGDCEGELFLKTHGKMLDIDTSAVGTNLAIIQPPQASAGFQTVGPMPPPRGGGPAGQPAGKARAVWSEPQLRVKGLVHVDRQSGGILADHLQLSGDWFASTLSGDVVWNPEEANINLKGPSASADGQSRPTTDRAGGRADSSNGCSRDSARDSGVSQSGPGDLARCCCQPGLGVGSCCRYDARSPPPFLSACPRPLSMSRRRASRWARVT